MTPKILINLLPSDMCCERCGKHVKDLKPFGKAGDPLVGDFDGQFLVKTFRSGCLPVEEIRFREIEKKYQDLESYDGFVEELEKVFGQEKADQLLMQEQMACTVSASWECRDCIIKDDY